MIAPPTWSKVCALAGDFDYNVLTQCEHRPWPLPSGPWLMTQTWTELAFVHWPLAPSVLRPLIPARLELDLFDGQAWLGLVPFQMSNVAPRGTPALPVLSAFPELNLRTYVRVGDRPGVFFFSLDAARLAAVVTARALFRLPYFWASMRVSVTGDVVHYTSRRRRGEASFDATYEPAGPAFSPEAGTLEYFLTERYCLYTMWRDVPVRVDIHHPRWSLRPGQASVRVNTLAEAAGIALGRQPPLLHLADRQDVVAWRPLRV